MHYCVRTLKQHAILQSHRHNTTNKFTESLIEMRMSRPSSSNCAPETEIRRFQSKKLIGSEPIPGAPIPGAYSAASRLHSSRVQSIWVIGGCRCSDAVILKLCAVHIKALEIFVIELCALIAVLVAEEIFSEFLSSLE